jgi:spermidine synthase
MTDWVDLPASIGAGKRGVTEFVLADFGHIYVPVRVLCRERTAFQELEIIETETFGRVLFLDGKIQVSELDEERYHQYLVQGPILAHSDPRSVYLIGGGDGGGIEEAAKHAGIRRIVMAELDRGVIDRCREHLPSVSRGAFDDPRLDLRCVDALDDLRRHSDAYDVIIVDLTEPHGPSKMLYTREFYQLLATRLTPGGTVGLHTDNYWLFPESYGVIDHTLRSVFGDRLATAQVGMPCFAMDWSFRVASVAPIDLDRLERRCVAARAGGMQLDAFEPAAYRLRPTPRERAVLERFRRVSTDADPYDKFEAAPSFITGKSEPGAPAAR